MTTVRDIRHFHMFLGLGGGKKGFNRARPSIPGMQGRYVYIGGMDSDPAGVRDADRLSPGMPSTVRDLFDRAQYVAFHGKEPPANWVEATPADVRNAAHGLRPNVVFLSAPCKGFSGLLSETRSLTAKYQALNRLTLRGVWLMLEAWADDPPEFILFENVPRIANRGRHLLDQIISMIAFYGYAVRETTHDCGEIGNLHQSRKRFLLVARHTAKVPAGLYEPPKRPLRAVGELLERMHTPGDPAAGPMHRIPKLAWKTWVRLAFVRAGADWRSLNDLAVENGHLRDYLIVPEAHGGYLGVREWDKPSGTVTSRGTPSCGSFSIADPRHTGPAKHSNEFRIVPFDDAARSITRAHGTGQCVADPRRGHGFSKYAITGWDDSSGTVISGSTTGQGAFAVADPRPGLSRGKGDAYLTAGHYGVSSWSAPSGAVSAAAGHDNGRWSVADPRLPALNDKCAAIIRATDGTWHRPFTTLELAALQSLYDPDDYAEFGPMVLDGPSDSAWRERIGNAVPPDAAEAIAEEMGRAILLAWAGESFQLSSTPIWVRPLATALSVASEGAEA